MNENLEAVFAEAQRRNLSMVDTLNAMLAKGEADFVFVRRPENKNAEGVVFVVGRGEVQSFRNQSRPAEGASDGGRKRVRKRRG